MTYKPTKGDLAYRNNDDGEIDPFNEAKLLRKVSHEYLSALAHDNAGPGSTGYKAMIDAEIARRGSMVAQRANWIALAALGLSIYAVFS